jgi:uncharacterized membrane protein YraQ (UPF0718 family)
MWWFAFIPDAMLFWIINIILLAGIIGFVASFFFGAVVRFIPALRPHRMILQIVSIILLIAGVYFKGGYSVEQKWRERVAELEAKVAVAEQQSKDANAKIETVYVDKVRVVKETQVVIQEKIRDVQVNIDSQCKITPEVVDVHNQAAAGVKKK